MTPERIKELAEEAYKSLDDPNEDLAVESYHEIVQNNIGLIEAAIREAVAERTEAAAKLAESMAVKHLPMHASNYHAVDAVALAIRAMKETE